jgi:hypothetical protein
MGTAVLVDATFFLLLGLRYMGRLSHDGTTVP